MILRLKDEPILFYSCPNIFHSMSYIIVNPKYPHSAVSNSAVRMMKGEIREFHGEFTAAPSAFMHFKTRKEAKEYLDANDAPQVVKTVPLKIPARTPFRSVHSPGGSSELSLLESDIHKFLSREGADVLHDIPLLNLKPENAATILAYERQHFHRVAVVDLLHAAVGEITQADEGLEANDIKGGYAPPSDSDSQGAPETRKEDAPHQPPSSSSEFNALLVSVKGIGMRTARDIMKVFKSETELRHAVKKGAKLPFRDDIEKKLKSKFR